MIFYVGWFSFSFVVGCHVFDSPFLPPFRACLIAGIWDVRTFMFWEEIMGDKLFGSWNLAKGV